jgi:hypothetical protein
MMSTPTVVQLVAAIRQQLSEVVAPELEDPGLRKVLAMIDHLLQTIAVRAEHEIEWMVAHTDDVVELGRRFAPDEDASEAVGAALSNYERDRGDSLSASAVTKNFGLAAAVLSSILEATVHEDGLLARRARELLERDVARGVEVVGDFDLVPP